METHTAQILQITGSIQSSQCVILLLNNNKKKKKKEEEAKTPSDPGLGGDEAQLN